MWFCVRFASADEKCVDSYLVGEGKKSIGNGSYDVGSYSIMGWNLGF